MNKVTLRLVYKIATLISLLFLLGCASSPWRVTDANIRTELVSSRYLEMSQVIIFEEPNGFSIRGDMRENLLITPRPKGHIDIDIVDSKNLVLHKTTASLHWAGKINRQHEHYKFNTVVPHIPPEGSIIRVAYHDASPHSEALIRWGNSGYWSPS